jgi:hypothetical protein
MPPPPHPQPDQKVVNDVGVVVHDEGPPAYIPDMAAEADALEWAGVSLGREEHARVALAIRRLAAHEHDVKSARFFGKFFGRYLDYYVAEVEFRTRPKRGGAAGGG